MSKPTLGFISAGSYESITSLLTSAIQPEALSSSPPILTPQKRFCAVHVCGSPRCSCLPILSRAHQAWI